MHTLLISPVQTERLHKYTRLLALQVVEPYANE